MCELEHGYRTFIVPGGQSALALVDLALLASGDHVLLPESIYGPNRNLADVLLQRLGVEVSYYPPLVGATSKSASDRTRRLVWCESPGSNTMEVQDVPAIVAAAHAHDAVVALDNTWAAGVYFDAFAHGVDISVQALTKYIGGHADLLLGSVTLRDATLYRRVGETLYVLGMTVSPDECSLALRGLQTLAVRLDAVERSALEIAEWLATRPEIAARPASRAAIVSRSRVVAARLHRFERRVLGGLRGTLLAGRRLPVRRRVAVVPARLQLGRSNESRHAPAR